MVLNKFKIVILGVGYGGLMMVIRLIKFVGLNDVDIMFVNKYNYYYEMIWMYEVSVGMFYYDCCCYQIKDVINQLWVNFVQDIVKVIKIDEKKVVFVNGELQYDYLVIGFGVVFEMFGIKGLKEYVFLIVNINMLCLLWEYIELQFVIYYMEVEKWLDRLMIVVGGVGFMGIEFFGELVVCVFEFCKEYDVDRSFVCIICVEVVLIVLSGFDFEFVDYVVYYFEENGVEFKIGMVV